MIVVSPYTVEVTRPREPVGRDTFLDEGRLVAPARSVRPVGRSSRLRGALRGRRVSALWIARTR